jgi:hypothetical protein
MPKSHIQQGKSKKIYNKIIKIGIRDLGFRGMVYPSDICDYLKFICKRHLKSLNNYEETTGEK